MKAYDILSFVKEVSKSTNKYYLFIEMHFHDYENILKRYDFLCIDDIQVLYDGFGVLELESQVESDSIFSKISSRDLTDCPEDDTLYAVTIHKGEVTNESH